jgi:hypothetical protein
MRGRLALVATLAGIAGIASIDAQAAENATGWYALGTKGSMSGFLPCVYRKPRPRLFS